MRPLPLIAGLSLLVAACALAPPDEEDELAQPPAEPKGPVVAVAETAAVSVAAGHSATLTVELNVAPGFHVQANPAGNEFLIPLSLSLTAPPGLVLAAPVYPPPVMHELQGSDQPLPTYEGAVSLSVPLEASEAAEPGPRSVEGTLRYQACDDRRCLAPVTLPVTLPLTVE